MAEKNTDFKKALSQLEETLEIYLVKKAPFTIPENIKELIVSFAPYLVIIGVIFGVPAVLAVLGLGALVSPFSFLAGPSYAVSYGFNYILSMIIFGIVLVLEAMAVPGLFKRQKKAWQYLFYASLIGLVSSLLGGNILGGLIGALIGWYLLFQVKEYYK
ncbi:MAG: chromate transporter [Microgenomates group bacterium]